MKTKNRKKFRKSLNELVEKHGLKWIQELEPEAQFEFIVYGWFDTSYHIETRKNSNLVNVCKKHSRTGATFGWVSNVGIEIEKAIELIAFYDSGRRKYYESKSDSE